MPRKPKNESEIVDTPAVDPLARSASGGKAPRKGAKAARKSSAKAAKKKPASKARKTPAKRPPAAASEPSEADIRLRAYFIAERRVQMALKGDSSKDWIEAKQQLLEEAQQMRA